MPESPQNTDFEQQLQRDVLAMQEKIKKLRAQGKVSFNTDPNKPGRYIFYGKNDDDFVQRMANLAKNGYGHLIEMGTVSTTSDTDRSSDFSPQEGDSPEVEANKIARFMQRLSQAAGNERSKYVTWDPAFETEKR